MKGELKRYFPLILVLALTHGVVMSSAYEHGFRRGKNAHRAHLESFELDPARPLWETQKWHQYATRLEAEIERLRSENQRLKNAQPSSTEEAP